MQTPSRFHSSSRFARRFTPLDTVLTEFSRALQVLTGAGLPTRPYPACTENSSALTAPETRRSAGYMRVNHVGEICAQALYRGQAMGCADATTRTLFHQAAAEEVDHLAWCVRRLTELNSRPSFLNPCWYLGSFGLGLLASRVSVAYNLGFMAETEKQVQIHLEHHLESLPTSDIRSHQVIAQMHQDEIAHRLRAEQGGARPLPWPIPHVMHGLSRVMTTTAYWL